MWAGLRRTLTWISFCVGAPGRSEVRSGRVVTGKVCGVLVDGRWGIAGRRPCRGNLHFGAATITPGFNDAHQHPTSAAEQGLQVDLSPALLSDTGRPAERAAGSRRRDHCGTVDRRLRLRPVPEHPTDNKEQFYRPCVLPIAAGAYATRLQHRPRSINATAPRGSSASWSTCPHRWERGSRFRVREARRTIGR
jgi:hypothetical protein